MRRAKWRWVPTPRGVVHWIRETPWRHWLIWALLMVLMAWLPMRDKSAYFVRKAMKLSTVTMFAVILSNQTRLVSGSKRLRRQLRFVLPAQRGETSPVRVTIYRDGVWLGQDEGLVEFRDGMLRYRGDRTEFDLKVTDVVFPPMASKTGQPAEAPPYGFFGSPREKRAWAVLLVHDPTVRLHFFQLRVRGFGTIQPALYAWLERSEPGCGETRLPPKDFPGMTPSKIASDNGSLL